MSDVYDDGGPVAEAPDPFVPPDAADEVSLDSEIDYDDEQEEDQLPLDVVEAIEAGVLLDDPETARRRRARLTAAPAQARTGAARLGRRGVEIVRRGSLSPTAAAQRAGYPVPETVAARSLASLAEAPWPAERRALASTPSSFTTDASSMRPVPAGRTTVQAP